jgi:hypothetical protein
MLTALAAETRIKDRLNELQTTTAFLAALDGKISNTRLSDALRGLRDLENEQALRLLTLTQKMIEVRDAFAPVPLAWSKPNDVRWMLDNLTASPKEIRQTVLQLFRERI